MRKLLARAAWLAIAICLAGFSVEEAGNYELENAFRAARPTWPLRGFEQLPRVWAKQVDATTATGRAEQRRLLSLRAGDAGFRTELALRYGLYYDASTSNDNLPYGLTRTRANFVNQLRPAPGAGEPGITFNCRGCHSGVFFGTRPHGRIFTDGLSNVFIDIDRLDREIMTAAGFGIGNLFERNLPRNSMTNSADYFGRLLTYVRKPYPAFDLRTAYQAFYGRFRLPEHRHLERDVQAFLKTQSWVNVGTKWRATGSKGLYVDGGFYDNPSSIMYGIIFSLDPAGNDFLAADRGFLERGVPYLASLQAPPYPLLAKVDRQAARRGFDVYRKTCAGCHGTYEPDRAGGFALRSYPGRIIPLEKIGTDPLRAKDHGFGEVADGRSWVRPGRLILTGGYKAPPLHGIWARAPYLHNASVPNLRQLMKPETRVARYAIRPEPLDPANYDERNLGWKIQELPTAADVESLKKADSYVRIYDPDAYPYGLSNTGHTFGAKLTDAQIDDLVAFLKFL